VLLANLAQLSFGSVFERFLPVAGDQTRRFVIRAYVMCVTSALLFAIVYVGAGFGHRFLPDSFGWRAIFVVAVALWTIFILQDSVLIGLRASRWVPVENILFALAKLALIPILIAATRTQAIFLAWSAPVALTIIAVNWYLFVDRIPGHEASGIVSEGLPGTRELLLLAGAQYATLILTVSSTSIVTLIVLQRLGAVANAHYYVPAQIAAGPPLLAYSIARSFLVEASHEPHALRRHTNVAIRALVFVVVPCIIVGVVFAPELLRIFGTSYATHGTTLLRMLLLALPGTTITILYTTFAWIDKKVWWMTVRQLLSMIVFFSVLFATIGHVGILSVGIASLASAGAQGIFFLPITIRRYHRTADVDPGTPLPPVPPAAA
jgi:O-antigen/teichoic acid export membrane protein